MKQIHMYKIARMYSYDDNQTVVRIFHDNKQNIHTKTSVYNKLQSTIHFNISQDMRRLMKWIITKQN